MKDVVENNILSLWHKMQDTERGGFYGQMRGAGTLVKDDSKGRIINDKKIWAFSAAYRVLQRPEYLEAATRAKDYLLSHFIDKEYGGIFWELDADGSPIDTKKQFYAIGFAIYGLSEYARATHDKEALDKSIELFHCIE